MTLQQIDESVAGFVRSNRAWVYGGVGLVVAVALLDSASAVTVDSLRAPIQDLKKEIFGGWMFVAKIGACAAGVVFALAKQSLGPFGVGAGIGAGIHFYDKWIGDGSGALI